MKAYVVVKDSPDPEEGVPPGADQVTVTGAWPPLVVAEQLMGLPDVPVPSPQLAVMRRGWEEMVTGMFLVAIVPRLSATPAVMV